MRNSAGTQRCRVNRDVDARAWMRAYLRAPPEATPSASALVEARSPGVSTPAVDGGSLPDDLYLRAGIAAQRGCWRATRVRRRYSSGSAIAIVAIAIFGWCVASELTSQQHERLAGPERDARCQARRRRRRGRARGDRIRHRPRGRNDNATYRDRARGISTADGVVTRVSSHATPAAIPSCAKRGSTET